VHQLQPSDVKVVGAMGDSLLLGMGNTNLYKICHDVSLKEDHATLVIRGGHRSSTTKMVNRAGELLATGTPDVVRLSQLKLSLQEKLDVLKQLD